MQQTLVRIPSVVRFLIVTSSHNSRFPLELVAVQLQITLAFAAITCIGDIGDASEHS